MVTAYVHERYTEAHRTPSQRRALAECLTAEGVAVVTDPDCLSRCEVAFCGGFQVYQSFRRLRQLGWYKGKVVHFNWDLYPWLVGPDRPRPESNYARVRAAWWDEYLDALKACAAILVPNTGTAKRTAEYAGRADARVVLSSCNPFDEPPWDGGHVMQSMRDYPDDPNAGLLERACNELGIRLIKPDGKLTDAEFRKAVTGARVLVSPYHEASTGGLALLEGYRLGKPVLICNSKLNGAWDYFGVRGMWFRDGDYEDLRYTLKDMVDDGGEYRRLFAKASASAALSQHNREWVDANYSTAAFARRLAAEFRRVVG